MQGIVLNNDKSWITLEFKDLVGQRNSAFQKGNDVDYSKLRIQDEEVPSNLLFQQQNPKCV